MKHIKTNNILSKVISVSGIVLIAKLLGFLKQMITANAFGATLQTDIISISEGLITNIDYLIVQAFVTAFVPIYINIKVHDKDYNKFFSNTVAFMMLISIVITGVFFGLSPLLAKVLAPSYSYEETQTLSKYIMVLTPALILILQIAVFNALLKANEKFNPGEMISVFQSITLIVLVIAIGRIVGANVLIIAFYVYAVTGLLYLITCSKKYCRIRLSNPFKDSDLKKMLKMMLPLLVGFSAIFINQQVDKIIVSGFGSGIVTAMSYASVLSNFVCSFITSICSIVFTYVSQQVANGDGKSSAEFIGKALLQMITILLPISLVTIFNSYDIVKLIFGRGAFNSDAVYNCSLSLTGYGIMFVPYAVRELFNRFQYAYGDSKTPTINSFIAIVINIFLSITLSYKFKIFGVALATSISVISNMIFGIITSKKKNKEIKNIGIIKYIPRWAIGSVFCVFVCIAGKIFLSELPYFLRLIIIVMVTFSGYGIINLSTLKRFQRRKSI